MNDKHLDDLFDQTIPDADPNAKKIAINSALSEFSQAFEETARPIDNRDNWFSTLNKSIRSFFMNPTKKLTSSGAFATVAVAFVALSLVYLWPNLQSTPDSITQNTTDKQPVPIEPNAVPQLGDESALEEIVSTGSSRTAKDDSSRTKTESYATEPVAIPEIAVPVTTIDTKKVLNYRVAKPTLKNETVSSIRQRSEKSFSTSNASLTEAGSPVAYDGKLRAPPSEPASGKLQRPDSDEEYADYQSNTISLVSESPVSTFSIDVDTASYSLIRSQLNSGYLPNPQAVRAEELINYFNYDYELPRSKSAPFQPTISVLDSPWNKGKKLVHIGIKGYELPKSKMPDSNLVFLLDVSGSMSSANKLPLVKQSINLLLDTLKPTDTVSIVVYAGAAGTVLEPTNVKEKSKIFAALDRLSAGGSTAGGAGIELAYQLAEQNFNKDAVNRIILATDGDFNVGQSSNEKLQTLVERKRDKGVFLSVLGFGRNNYQDDMMQTLAQNGNGVAAYIDTLSEAKKVLVDEATSTLFTIAKDVKIQVEFNPSTVSEYRLVGYETRALNREDFNNDKVDAGDIGAGHTVTAIYEITPANSKVQSIEPPRYADNTRPAPSTTNAASADEYGYLKMRYKLPTGTQSKLIEQAISTKNKSGSSEVLFSTAVAGFAQLLTGGKYVGDLNYDKVVEAAIANKGQDAFGYRSEFIQLARMAKIAKN